MGDFQMQTPVVLLIFNRPDTTEKVFETIRDARPPKLFVVADGPRVDRPGEDEKCKAARAVIDNVDWPCDVFTNFSDINLGCARRVSSGLDWVFDNVEQAIILEDDCVPHPTFFRFCQELLNYYRDDERIMVISGDNFQFGRKRTDYSYYFSRYNHCWGWATWKRAWKYFDFDMKLWPEVRDRGWLYDILMDFAATSYWYNVFQSTYNGRINSWAYRWTFNCWCQSGLTILPNVNLVSNIGFNMGATHTNMESPLAGVAVEPLCFPLKHPSSVIRDDIADKFTQNRFFQPGKLNYIRSWIKGFFYSERIKRKCREL